MVNVRYGDRVVAVDAKVCGRPENRENFQRDKYSSQLQFVNRRIRVVPQTAEQLVLVDHSPPFQGGIRYKYQIKNTSRFGLSAN